MLCGSIVANDVALLSFVLESGVKNLNLTQAEMDIVASDVLKHNIAKIVSAVGQGCVEFEMAQGSVKFDPRKLDRETRTRIVDILQLVSALYKECLACENIPLESCDRIFAAVMMNVARYYVSCFENEVAAIVEQIQAKQQN